MIFIAIWNTGGISISGLVVLELALEGFYALQFDSFLLLFSFCLFFMVFFFICLISFMV